MSRPAPPVEVGGRGTRGPAAPAPSDDLRGGGWALHRSQPLSGVHGTGRGTSARPTIAVAVTLFSKQEGTCHLVRGATHGRHEPGRTGGDQARGRGMVSAERGADRKQSGRVLVGVVPAEQELAAGRQ